MREFFSDMAFLRESIDLVLFVVDVNERTQLDLYRVTRQTMYFCSTFLLSSEEGGRLWNKRGKFENEGEREEKRDKAFALSETTLSR